MNSLRNTLRMAAVTLTVAAGCASAQGLKAEIPFTFKAGATVLPAGTYRLFETHNGARYIQLRNDDTFRSILLMPAHMTDPAKSWTDAAPKLTFVCGEGRCSLDQVWNGSGPAYQFHVPSFGKDAKTRIAVIVMHRDSD